ncbi:MAG: aminotransferase class V-fold PLP-dependent enzyme [Clostridiales Family XIII bacterium]|jgi:aspartate aminotransferase-like enzyme|nr:aminotransferase class V-fold PLP-dependent enzyme [Clostridiales Family XIII bacterium]
MKLFTLGPVEMYPDTLKLAGRPLPYFRTDAFSEVVLESSDLLRRFATAPAGSEVLLLTASGTAAMEAAVVNCFDENDKLLVIDGGTFGHRFAEICAYHHIPFESVVLPFGTALTADMLLPYDDAGFTGLLVNIHETSTGQLYDMDAIADFCKRNDLYLVADAIGSFLADETDMIRHGIDVLIVSSQKGLALAPGLSIVVLSERIFERKVRAIRANCMYFDFNDYAVNAKRGQTPFTPAVGVVIAMRERLAAIDEIGVDVCIRNTARMATAFRERLCRPPIKIPSYKLSNAVTPLIFEAGNAKEMYRALIERHGIYLNPNGGQLADKVLRVGHLGNLTLQDHMELADILRDVCGHD